MLFIRGSVGWDLSNSLAHDVPRDDIEQVVLQLHRNAEQVELNIRLALVPHQQVPLAPLVARDDDQEREDHEEDGRADPLRQVENKSERESEARLVYPLLLE